MNLKELQSYGQSPWLDYMRRDLLATGELTRLVTEGVRGITTNPSIFEKAIAESSDYDAAIEQALRREDEPGPSIYDRLAIEDIQDAADILHPVYDTTDRRDGYISAEVSPRLAYDTHATLAEARRLWMSIGRENLMIKVPATSEGIPAVEQLISEGINVNITLIFSRAVCKRVFDAYTSGLESLARRNGNLHRVASVASMFVSRIDTFVNAKLESRGMTGPRRDEAALVGKVAIANAKLAYQDWKEACQSARWQAIAGQGARAQRLLWASTSTKDRRFPDLAYVEALIGPDTVDTMTPATLDALRDHGKAASTLEEGVLEAREVMGSLARAGILIDEVTAQLLDEGVQSFSSAFDKLMASIERKRERVLGRRSARAGSATARR